MKPPRRKPGIPAPRLAQPGEMKTKSYVYGVETLNGYDVWALFEASARGDVPKAKALLAKDPRLVNGQYWYQFPIHMAVFAGNAEIAKLLLDHGPDPGQSMRTGEARTGEAPAKDGRAPVEARCRHQSPRR